MNRFVYFSFLFLLLSCNTTNSPSSVASSFSESLLQGNITKSKIYCTPETKRNVTLAGNLIKGFSFLNETNFQSKVVDTENVSNDEAVVTIEVISNKLSAPTQFDIVTHKIDGEWRVHFTYNMVEVLLEILNAVN